MERKVNLPDPALSGSALDFVTGYVKKNGKDGWNLFEQLKKNEVTVAGANQEALRSSCNRSKRYGHCGC